MFEQTFKNIDDVLRKDAGCSTELDYIEQTSWILFLRYLEEHEEERRNQATLSSREWRPILEPQFCWSQWAAPKANGSIDHRQALVGDDLTRFVNDTLFPYLQALQGEGIENKIGELFLGLKNKIESGYNLRQIIELVDGLHFRSQQEKHEMSHLYEDKIKNMGNAGRNGGEYYTPRPLIRAIIKVVQPTIGERIYDPACGSAGFLVEVYNWLFSPTISSKDLERLQRGSLFGKEKKPLPYIIGTINMILHGIEEPQILKTNTLSENVTNLSEAQRYDVVLANPPFGGSENREVQQNFVIKTGETAFLFLQHFIKSLKAGGRAGIVIKNTFLSNSDRASLQLRKELLESCDLHTILDLPSGVFQGAGVKTVVLFFTKGLSTQKIWYYQLDLGRTLGKTTPLNDRDLEEFINLHKTKGNSRHSWSVERRQIDTATFDLSVNNPRQLTEKPIRAPEEVAAELARLESQSNSLLHKLRELL